MSKASTVLDQMIGDKSINGQHVDVDHAFGGQCWDLVELYAELLGVPKASSPRPYAIPLGANGWASEAWTGYDKSPHMQKYFTKIPAGQQQKGDIVVYNGRPGFEEGHIAISLGGNSVFEENADPDGSVAHVQNSRSSTYLLGALRFKESAGNQEMPITKEMEMSEAYKATGSYPGKNYNYPFVGTTDYAGMIRTWQTRMRLITADSEHALADELASLRSGRLISGYIGHNYNSQFVGKPEVYYQKQMEGFWIDIVSNDPNLAPSNDSQAQGILSKIKSLLGGS